ncbi:MAG: M16 family metallopeptidase [Acidimicrobiales bacterium]
MTSTTETLPCGIRLATEAMPDVHSVAVGFWVGTGSRDEAEHHAGASHFLEHLLFKGTAGRSAAAIAEALDEVGGDCNAFTTKEYTTFYIRLLAEDLPLGLDILGDIMCEPALRELDVAAERTVILDEILMHADEPADLAAERWSGALFPGHPLGRDTLGTAESVDALTAADIRRFFAEHYRPANVVVSAAGRCDHAVVAEAVERRFAGQEVGGPPERGAPAAPPEPLVVLRRPTEQAHLVLGARSVSRFSEERWALAVLNHVLGGGLSSRLFQKVREERGLAYSIWSERVSYQDAGLLCVTAGTAPRHVAEVLAIVTGELELLAERGVTDRELSVAKGNLRADMLLAGEDSGARMNRLGSSLLLHGEVRTVEELLARIQEVGPDDVREAADHLAASPRTLAAVGPFDPDAFDSAALGLAGRAA